MEEAVAVHKRELAVLYPNAAGIDIGSAKHYVAVPPERCEQSVREFESFTADLAAMAEWLASCAIDTVVMESTGVYWIPVYELLESRGFTVYLVNARHVKNVSGKKSDVLDCQWLQQLMSFGLLAGAFRPDGKVCALRALVRQRETLIAGQAQQIQRMQKALTQMNVQLVQVISDSCKTREQFVNVLPPDAAPVGTFMPSPVKVLVGGAVCFVMDVQRFERF